MNNQPHLATRRVFVVAWHSSGSAGFDWYRTSSAADDAFVREKANCIELAHEEWEAYRFDVVVPLRLSDAAVTDLIDGDLDDYCAKAAITFRAPTTVIQAVEAPAIAIQATSTEQRSEPARHPGSTWMGTPMVPTFQP